MAEALEKQVSNGMVKLDEVDNAGAKYVHEDDEKRKKGERIIVMTFLSLGRCKRATTITSHIPIHFVRTLYRG